MKWMTRFQTGAKRPGESWMDLQPELDLNSPAIQAEAMLRRQNHIAQQEDVLAADDQDQSNHGRMIWNKPYMMRL